MSDQDRRDWANNIRRLSEADDAAAISFGRDLIKFGQWLNAGAVAALPIVANALNLRGAPLLASLGFPALLFFGGLVCSFFSTLFAFRALAHRGDARLAAYEAVSQQMIDATKQTLEGTRENAAIDASKKYEESSLLQAKFAASRRRALGFAVGSVLFFISGVSLASMYLLS